MAKLDTVKKIKEKNGQDVSVELTQRQLDDLLVLAELGEDGLEEFNAKHREYNDTLPEDVRLDLDPQDDEEEEESPELPDVPEGESARTVAEKLAEEEQVNKRKEESEALRAAIDLTVRPSKEKQTLEEVRAKVKESQRESLAISDDRRPPPEVTQGDKIKVRLNPKIQSYDGMIYDPSTRTKISGSEEVTVIRTPFITQKISQGELIRVESE